MAEQKEFTAEEVVKHNNVDSCWLVYKNHVYDVTKFLDNHPGGFDTVLEHAGTESTDAFDAVGHSKSAEKQLKEHLIGSISAEEVAKIEGLRAAAPKPAASAAKPSEGHGMPFMGYAVPIIILAVAVYYHFFVAPKVSK